MICPMWTDSQLLKISGICGALAIIVFFVGTRPNTGPFAVWLGATFVVFLAGFIALAIVFFRAVIPG
jgi:hypothetical protein